MKKKIRLEKHNQKITSYDIVVKGTLVYNKESVFHGEVYAC